MRPERIRPRNYANEKLQVALFSLYTLILLHILHIKTCMFLYIFSALILLYTLFIFFTAALQPLQLHAGARAVRARGDRVGGVRCSVYLLYWYNSTNTDRVGGGRLCRQLCVRRAHRNQFSCFTGTTVQILTELVEADFVDNSACVELIENKGWGIQVNPKFTCFTGTKVQILTLKRLPGYPR
jgi:hypothetical protein